MSSVDPSEKLGASSEEEEEESLGGNVLRDDEHISDSSDEDSDNEEENFQPNDQDMAVILQIIKMKEKTKRAQEKTKQTKIQACEKTKQEKLKTRRAIEERITATQKVKQEKEKTKQLQLQSQEVADIAAQQEKPASNKSPSIAAKMLFQSPLSNKQKASSVPSASTASTNSASKTDSGTNVKSKKTTSSESAGSGLATTLQTLSLTKTQADADSDDDSQLCEIVEKVAKPKQKSASCTPNRRQQQTVVHLAISNGLPWGHAVVNDKLFLAPVDSKAKIKFRRWTGDSTTPKTICASKSFEEVARNISNIYIPSLAELQTFRNTGTWFDAEIVRTFCLLLKVENFQNKIIICQRRLDVNAPLPSHAVARCRRLFDLAIMPANLGVHWQCILVKKDNTAVVKNGANKSYWRQEIMRIVVENRFESAGLTAYDWEISDSSDNIPDDILQCEQDSTECGPIMCAEIWKEFEPEAVDLQALGEYGCRQAVIDKLVDLIRKHINPLVPNQKPGKL